jgi:hypothetical protein
LGREIGTEFIWEGEPEIAEKTITDGYRDDRIVKKAIYLSAGGLDPQKPLPRPRLGEAGAELDHLFQRSQPVTAIGREGWARE